MMLRRIGVYAVVLLCGAFAGRGDAAMISCDSTSCVNLVFDGDSISAGVGSTSGHGLDAVVTAAMGDPVVKHNVAVGGRPVHDCLSLYPKLVAPLYDTASGHNIIVFHAGDNDINQGSNAAETYAAFTAYVSMAHRQGWKVVISTELRRYAFPPAMEQQLEDYNRQLRANAAGADAVVDLDSEPKLLDPSYRKEATLFTQDGVHPNDGGYVVLARLLAPAVRQAAGR
jgi:lysophospholipase L1-like esterase